MTKHPAIASGVYEIQVDSDGLNVDLAPRLVDAARTMTVTPSTRSWVAGQPPNNVTIPCVRCTDPDCLGAIEGEVPGGPASLVGRVAHLTASHGYRMDGHRYGNDNRRLDDDHD